MHPQKSKPTETSWAALLKKDLHAVKDPFTPAHKSLDEIRKEFKDAGLPFGRSYVQKWLQSKLDSGAAVRVEGHILNSQRRLVRATRYLLK